jgi:hypothetical protein
MNLQPFTSFLQHLTFESFYLLSQLDEDQTFRGGEHILIPLSTLSQRHNMIDVLVIKEFVSFETLLGLDVICLDPEEVFLLVFFWALETH